MAKDDRISNAAAFVGGLGIGAGLMYMLDPDDGRRRRHMARDKIRHGVHVEADLIGKGARDLSHRAEGLMARARRGVRRHEEIEDDVLVGRVRSALGRFVTHPGSIDVTARDGCVTLRGPILADEVDDLVSGVERVRGVREVVRQLDVHDSPGRVPGLQGEGRQRAGGAAREAWMPGTRVLAGTAGVAMTLGGLARGGVAGQVAALAGGALLVRAMTNLPARRLLGIGAGRDVIRLQKTIHVDAPVADVFALWSDFESFPQFMEHVREVRVTDGHSHWKLDGPAGIPIAFDAETTALVPNEVVAWKTVPRAAVEHAGIVRFEEEDGGTRISVLMTYNPPAGAVGHAVASLLGRDPKSQMDDDLLRMKTLLETGRTRAHGQKVEREPTSE